MTKHFKRKIAQKRKRTENLSLAKSKIGGLFTKLILAFLSILTQFQVLEYRKEGLDFDLPKQTQFAVHNSKVSFN
ncbi:hypothetical protein Mgra_00006181 [Meloidogyne graminicola]|uniref:Uncharacterized protein n=1 Tax=Meloidogyne graminicola TaxID=189291 RepID=A0A8S9ZMW6_9BILA|nr:hypothetical protein Mgra_00006181 [Meloidogyne graminicola]